MILCGRVRASAVKLITRGLTTKRPESPSATTVLPWDSGTGTLGLHYRSFFYNVNGHERHCAMDRSCITSLASEHCPCHGT